MCRFGTYKQFTARYCEGFEGKFGWQARGSSNEEELKILLERSVMIRCVPRRCKLLGVSRWPRRNGITTQPSRTCVMPRQAVQEGRHLVAATETPFRRSRRVC